MTEIAPAPTSSVTTPSILKVTVNLPADTMYAIRDMASSRQITVTEQIRQALETERFLRGEIARGSKVLLEKTDGSIRQVVFR